MGRQLTLFRLQDRWVRRIRVESQSNPDQQYTVAIDGQGEVGCSCGAWVYDGKRRACKHILALVSEGTLPDGRVLISER